MRRRFNIVARELAHKRNYIEVDAYGERRDIDGSEADGDVGMARVRKRR